MEPSDARLLTRAQSGFPIEARPFRQIGDELGMPEQDVLDRLRRLKAGGLIRRIGATFHADRLGYVSTLVGMQVPGERIESVAEFVGRFPEVTHNYERDGDWNLWFTLVAPSAERLAAVLDAVRGVAPGCRLVSLPAKRRYKVRVEFDLVRLNDGSLADR